MSDRKKKKNAYVDSTGTVVPSVTTIIGRFKDSGPLLFWAFKKGKTHGEAAMRAIVETAMGQITENFMASEDVRHAVTKAVNAAVGDLAIHKLYDDTAAVDAGTVAHDLVEHFIRTGEDGRSTIELRGEYEAVEKGKSAFETFLRWLEMTKVELRHTEVELVSEKHKFGGKLDAIGHISQLCLLDWKTSNAVYLDYTIQLGGYGILWDENYPEFPLEGGFHLLRFAKENGDFAHHHYPNLDLEKVAFLKMRSLYDDVKICEKRTK